MRLVQQCLGAVPVGEVMRELARISAFDRYQASLGIQRAAEVVAEAAERAGLAQVRIDQFPADGRVRWWSFRAPVAWTPLMARLTVVGEQGYRFEIDHARSACTLATHSAPTPAVGVTARLADVPAAPERRSLAGAIALVAGSRLMRPGFPALLAHAGALGFVTDAGCRGGGAEAEHAGRVELEPGAPLFGFCVTTAQLSQLRAAAGRGALGTAVVTIDRSASMPMVSGILPGERPGGEVWLTGHLCHPRPGANDNASGAAALLGVAAACSALRHGGAGRRASRTVRFLWGPEFVGPAAMLCRRLEEEGSAGRPSAVVNLDMVGEDQELCGGPFLVERPPDCHPALLGPIAEHVVSEVFAQTAGSPGVWRGAPFTGFSDHAVFADRATGCPAVHLCHAPDRFNHSAGDSLDKVSPVEMLRASAAGAALARILSTDGLLDPPTVAAVVRRWCAAAAAEAARTAGRHRRVRGGEWSRRLLEAAARHHAALLRLAGEAPEDGGGADPRPAPGGGLLARRFQGPFNARAMLGDLPRARRQALARFLAADKQRLALLSNFALRADGTMSMEEIVEQTSFSLGTPVGPRTAGPLLEGLIESGWCEKVAAPGGAPP